LSEWCELLIAENQRSNESLELSD